MKPSPHTVPLRASGASTHRLMKHPLFFTATLLLAACFGSHGSDDGPSDDAPRVDMGRAPVDAGAARRDAGRAADATPPPRPDGGGADCSPERADLSCGLAPFPSGVPFDLPVSIGSEGECYCGEFVGCNVSIRRDPSGDVTAIDLSTSVCAGDLLCDGCFPYIEGRCHVPALPSGSYPVWIEGARAFDLRVEEDGFVGEEQCTRVAEFDRPACGPVSWPPERHEVGEVCHLAAIPTGFRPTIRVVDECAGCDHLPGPCTVTLDESGLAPTLRVETTRTRSACGMACPDLCARLEHRCVAPDDLPLGRYEVIVNGRNLGTWISVTDTPTSAEMCSGGIEG